MEYSADPRLTDTEITELSEVFVKIYENGAYDPEEGNKTPAQRKQVKFQFKKTLVNDLKKMSKYYYCIFRTVLEADISKMSLLRRRVKEEKRAKETLIQDLERKRETMKNDIRKEIRDELQEGYFKEQAEQNKRLKKMVNDLNRRVQYLNDRNEELQMDSMTWVARKDHETLKEQYVTLLEKTTKKKIREQTDEDKEKEKKRKELEEIQKKRKQMEEDEAKLMAELECNNDPPENITISCSSSDEE
jgi:DNA repair exonuclease SbcCD ATPase subunit